jgi:hypothetical protein
MARVSMRIRSSRLETSHLRFFSRTTSICLALAVLLQTVTNLHAETDLDAFMRQVLARRDDNWRKLQQYVLDEREQIEVRGPSRQPIWGEQREYTWYIRDGFFVRSPIKINGVRLSEADRQKYEAEFLERTKARDARAQKAAAEAGPGGSATDRSSASDRPEGARSLQASAGPGVDGLLRQVREPQFISSAYFLRFKFEDGRYALVGREMVEGRETLRIEYFPTNLYSQRQQRRVARSHDRTDPQDAEIMRMLNKVALVTLWIEPESKQIVKYTFDNIDLDFLPVRWFVRLESVRASMTMSQPFADVWLPKNLEFLVTAELASGRYDVRGTVDYDDYRQADVKTKVDVGSGR